jgi:hypothetical protein
MNSPDVEVDADDTSDDIEDNPFGLFSFLMLLMGVDSISVSISGMTAMLVAFPAHFCS